MANFRIWLEQEQSHDYDSEQDKIEHDAFEFVFDKIKKATDVALQSPPSSQKGMAFRDAMMKVWPESEDGRGIKFILPKDRFPSLESLRIRLNSYKDESSVDSSNGRVFAMYIGTASLQKSIEERNKAEVERHLMRISGSLNHEMTHLHHRGADGDGETPEEAVRYMTNPGEIRAHAKDYAYTWAQNFPGQPFDAERFVREVIPTLVDSKKNKATHYFVTFLNPEKQAQYKAVADLGLANRQLMEMVKGYVDYFVRNARRATGQGQPQPAATAQNAQRGFQVGDPRTWQQRQQHLNSLGIDTTGWQRQEIMRGVKTT